jgi:hypothetical protein
MVRFYGSPFNSSYATLVCTNVDEPDATMINRATPQPGSFITERKKGSNDAHLHAGFGRRPSLPLGVVCLLFGCRRRLRSRRGGRFLFVSAVVVGGLGPPRRLPTLLARDAVAVEFAAGMRVPVLVPIGHHVLEMTTVAHFIDCGWRLAWPLPCWLNRLNQEDNVNKIQISLSELFAKKKKNLKKKLLFKNFFSQKYFKGFPLFCMKNE